LRRLPGTGATADEIDMGSPAPGSSIGGVEVHSLRPVRTGSALNKDGQLVLSGLAGDVVVKVYEARSAAHAQFIHAVSQHPRVGALFPKVLAVEGPVVVAEWIEGTSVTEDVGRVARLQQQLHSTPAAELPVPGFDYWHEYLEPRFLRALRVLGQRTPTDLAIEIVREHWQAGRQTLMNPDVTPDNLLLDSAGTLKVVDTGDMTRGGLPLLDVVNTANALPSDLRTDYVRQYFSGGALPPPPDAVHALNAAWLARAVGAFYVSGRLDRAASLLDAFANGQSVLPVALDARPAESVAAPLNEAAKRGIP
jgi:hypothetical protein